ncbi:MAG: DUF1934 domain-containing protein [Clostridium sp.]|uniref:DUF1934 domain-containing protein n=1 Tax=Clostridium sp. TaxID=1506 RepID=UPI00290ABD7F|nr:DUF1934 domain-containing protein [Clostridium sp.]MDU7338675.1 DUF1934 domain-containing protein [Clostridium sp.]
MQENYWIDIIGRQKIDDDVGEIKLTTLGSYVTKGDTHFIVYKEYDADRNNESTTSVLKVDGNNTVTLMRGSGNTRLILEKGKRHQCQYDTGFGALLVGVFTSDVDSRLHDKGGELAVDYTLDINADLSSINEIRITIKEAEHKDVENSTTSNG